MPKRALDFRSSGRLLKRLFRSDTLSLSIQNSGGWGRDSFSELRLWETHGLDPNLEDLCVGQAQVRKLTAEEKMMSEDGEQTNPDRFDLSACIFEAGDDAGILDD